MIRFAVGLWAILMGAVVAFPLWSRAPGWEEALTRYTIRPSLAYYGVTLAIMLFLRPADWLGQSPRCRLARCCWTLAWAAYLVHVAIAFSVYHHGSHEAAVQHVQERSGFGPGLYFSHLFTLLWSADVAWWWTKPSAYAVRPGWIDWLLHGYMLFMVVNATVVFENGLIRWATAALLGGLAVLWCWRLAVTNFSRSTT